VNTDMILLIVLISSELQKGIHANKMSYPAKRKRNWSGLSYDMTVAKRNNRVPFLCSLLTRNAILIIPF
jgi:hypothetical protein